MKMLGVRAKLNGDKLKVDSSRVEIAKETAKRYELTEINNCMDYLTFVHKEEVGIIRKYYSSHCLENIIFEIDNGTEEQQDELKRKLIDDIIKELAERQDIINKMIEALSR